MAWLAASSPAKRPAPMHGYVQVPNYACLWPVNPAVADYPDLSGLGERQMPLYVPTVALAAPVMDQRLGWSCAALPAVSERLHHMLHHVPETRWDVPGDVLAVGIASPATTINAALAAEGLSVDLTEAALLAVPLYTVTASDRARTLEVCRSTYAVAA
ncbi:hypothetical protein [Rhodophyticola porphyridii]|uniref:hypothetical protein n=1 Tax=Rhodophyticola porphyridii TaxID=1852017 RepID=UPI0013144BE0|nr:hypothetical protein [Rhodophyticola porphyridii]